MSSTKLATSEQVLHRIHWDPRLDPEDFVVGYEERFQGRKEMPASEFPLGGEIPWHRVWTVRLGEVVVWDRQERLDRMAEAPELQESHRATRPPRAATGSPPHTGASYDPEAQAWLHHDASSPVALPGLLRVCTFNVLFDLYDKDQIHTAQRLPATSRMLRESGADLIALQEITPGSLEALHGATWLQQGYSSSAVSGDPGIAPYGQVLLSRWPMASVRQIVHSGRKKSLLVRLATEPVPLAVAVVHLTSNRQKDAQKRRSAQLQALLEQLDDDEACLLMGDFNSRGEGLVGGLLEEAGFVDVWPCLHPKDPGYTFDPHRNPLAHLTSQSQTPGRLDRIFVREALALSMLPCDAGLWGQEPIAQIEGMGPLHASDHFALRATLQLESP